MATIQTHCDRFEGIRAVLFDKDGTLASVEGYLLDLAHARVDCVERQIPGIRASLLSALGIQKGQIDPTGLMAVGSRYENEIAVAAYVAATGLGWGRSLAITQQAFESARATLPTKVTQTHLIKGVPQLLDRLKRAQVKVAVVSSDTEEEVKAFIEHNQLKGIDWSRGAAPEQLSKTHPGFLQLACAQLGVAPENTLVVGDSTSDVALASQGAAGFIGVSGGWQQVVSFEPKVSTVTRLCQLEIST